MVLLLAGHSSCYMLDRWTEYLQYGGQIDVMYSDFEKTFDKSSSSSRSVDVNWPSYGKGENKSQLIDIIRQCFKILIRICNPSRIRNIRIERSKQLYHNFTLPLFSPLPKLGQWCDVSWPREFRLLSKLYSYGISNTVIKWIQDWVVCRWVCANSIHILFCNCGVVAM